MTAVMSPPGNGQTAPPGVGVDIRDLVPKLGLREYWYPALLDKEVKAKKGTYLKLLGDDLVAFRGKNGNVVIMTNACPHRGAMLDHGDCWFPGTITCFYHGYTFDEHGECVASIGEGPDSPLVGRVRARVYPTVTVKGIVFVWMGAGEPTEPEHGIPDDFFEPGVTVMTWVNQWKAPWRPCMENIDAHYAMIHRNALRVLMRPFPKFSAGGGGRYNYVGHRMRAARMTDDTQSSSRVRDLNADPQDYFPGVDAKWPFHNYRRLWTWMFAWADRRRIRMSYPLTEEWGAGHHLPGIFRQNFGGKVFSRWIMPIDEDHTRLWYFHSTRPTNGIGRLYERVHFTLIGNWLMNKDFSDQDSKGSVYAYHNTREHLSPWDVHTHMWRQFLLRSPELRAQREAVGLEGLANAAAPAAAEVKQEVVGTSAS
jgi:phenylpropionate dioxygenase-like ring-hydroxylating dioxygenase large terminal subunit